MRIKKKIFCFENYNKLNEYFNQHKEEIIENNKMIFLYDHQLENKDILDLFDRLNEYIQEFNNYPLKKNDLDQYLNLYADILLLSIKIIKKLKKMYDKGYFFTYTYIVKLNQLLKLKFFVKNMQMNAFHPLVISIIYELQKGYIKDINNLKKINSKKSLKLGNNNFIVDNYAVFLNNIYSSYLNRELDYYLSNNNQLYYAYHMNKDYKIKLASFDQISSYYKISDLRLIEKIESRYAQFNSKNNVSMKIAIFGNMDIRKIKSTLKNISIDIFHIKQKKELIFECHTKKISLYNFNEITDLAKEYQLIFLLDNGYFYKEYEKDVSSIFNNKDIIKKDKFYIKKLSKMFTILCHSFLTDKMTTYKYNDKLFYLLNNAVQNSNCEIYMYIAKGSVDEEQPFLNSVFCKDEYYNGYNTTVVKLPQCFIEKNNISLKVLETEIDRNRVFSFNLWKLFKSISDDFCFDLFTLYKKEIIFEYLYHTNVFLEFEFEDLILKKVNYFIKSEKINDLAQISNDYLGFYLNIIFNDVDFYFKNNIENIFFSILSSSVKDMHDLFVIYLMKYHIVDVSQVEVTRSELNNLINDDEKNIQFSFQDKKRIENIMIKLDQLVLRNSTDRIKYIEEYFYLNTEGNNSYEYFYNVIQMLQILCKKYKYTSCNLFINIKDYTN